ncbi:hypothetical protein N0B31_15730 [Salinirubellus salinus]|uniref:Uncharacterized protein n=1 Tax=Salinirubellus salinus TaxID=1364945 RepID=A0A9E7U7H5_9EURY|nr:hypothetical protein [Salinirubellus salinus]UWM53581.1 hypothetical protein N0B31_15730 [Salinirubellus salinus]
MGIIDTLRSALGLGAEDAASRRADPEDLFGMTTAYVTMEAELGYAPTGDAGLLFNGVDSSQFRRAVEEIEAILEAGAEETGTEFEVREDSRGGEWVVLHDDDFEDLVTSVHFAADQLSEEGFGSRLLSAVFAFGGNDKRVYWLYSFRRGAYYPFVPKRGHERDSTAEVKLESVLDGELNVEDDTSYWYPLWSDTPGGHPWE